MKPEMIILIMIVLMTLNQPKQTNNDMQIILKHKMAKKQMIQETPQYTYSMYMQDNPGIGGYDQGEYYQPYLDELESTGFILMAEPKEMLTEERYITLTDQESDQIQASRMAHAIYLDKNNKLPWHLSEYSKEEIDTLFDYPPETFTVMVDHSVSEVYNYTKVFIEKNQKTTAYNIIYHTRFFEHGKTPQSIYHPHTVIQALTEIKETVSGCHTMSIILQAMLNSVNIPAYYDTGWYKGKNHGSLIILGDINKVLMHGDDIYNHTDPDEILMNLSWFKEYIEPCGKLTQCAYMETNRYLQYKEYSDEDMYNICCKGFVYLNGTKTIGCYHLINNDGFLYQTDKDYLLNYWLKRCKK